MEPKLNQLDETSSTKKENIEQLQTQRSEKVANCKSEEETVSTLKTEVETLKSNSDRELMEVKEKVEGIFSEKLIEYFTIKVRVGVLIIA